MKIRTVMRVLAVSLLVTGVVQTFGGNNKAEAYAQVSGTGYFSGNTEYGDGDSYAYDVISGRSSGGEAIPSWVYSSSSGTLSSDQIKANFIKWLDGKVTQNTLPTTHDTVGASFIVNTILGYKYPASTRTISTSWWNEMVERINRPDVAISLVIADPNDYSPNDTTSFNNYGLGSNDVFYSKWDTVYKRQMLVFKQAGKVVFVIEIPCANPLGGLPGIPAIPNTPPILGNPAVTCTLLSGAAWDYDNFDAYGPTYLNVQVYIDGPMGSGTRIANLTADDTEANGHKHGYSVNISSYTKYTSRTFYVYARDIDPWGRYATPTAYAMKQVSAGPCNDSQCVSSTFPDSMEVGVPQTFNTKTSMTYAWASPPYSVGNPAMHVTIWNPANTAIFNSDVGYTPSGTLLTSNNITFTPATPGTYRMQWSLRGQGLDITCPQVSGVPTFETGRAFYKPYLAVYGGDVLAGSSPSVDASSMPSGCTVTNSAGVYSWNTGNASYAGAGASYAVMALGQIRDFASTQGSVGAPTRLSFANANNSPYSNTVASGMFGGGAGSVPATCDFISDLSTTAPGTSTPVAGHSVSGTEEIFTTGDIKIQGNVTYATTSWGNLASIPKFKLVVIGNIFIDKNVTQLDGLYVAIPDSNGNGGNIFTCSTGASAVLTTSPTFYTDCDAPLTVNGAFVAKSVQFLRTFGSMSKPGAAEQFNYSPELWLPRTINTVSSEYNSITGLPPVL